MKKDFLKYRIGEAMIALQYFDGFDLNRYSDIVWLSKSGIAPKRILVYFEHSESLAKESLDILDNLGIKWIYLKQDTLNRKNSPFWSPSSKELDKFVKKLKFKPRNEIERWLYQTGKQLLREVGYWHLFYKEFNIRVHFVGLEATPKYFAQSIAFDVSPFQGGLLIGKQRSELYNASFFKGQYPNDVYFTWNALSSRYLEDDYNPQVKIVVGYPNDYIFKGKFKEAAKLRTELKSKGVKFIFALFDESHAPDYSISTEMMNGFYLAFLNWLIREKEIGLVIKSKKPFILDGLPQILPILNKAKATGRCIYLENEYGRMPLDAAAVSDMVVSIGYSAMVESAIAGCRGVICDMTCLRSHDFYRWGFEQIIFDDLDRMLVALKKYVKDKESIPNLGDWSPFSDRLDPFMDGRAGERMGVYLRWILEGFDAGFDREKALLEANAKYSLVWGDGKIQGALR